MTYDPSDEESVAEEEHFREGRDAWRAEAWTWMVRDPRGRHVLAELLLSTGYTSSSYVPGSFDATAFNEGRRAIGIGLREKIALNYAQYLPDIDRQLRGLMTDGGSGGGDTGQ